MKSFKTLAIIYALALSFSSQAQWELETLPDGRSEISSVAIGDNIYFVGGALSGVQRYFKMNIFNVITQSWTTVDVPNGTKGSRTVAIDKKIYFGDIEGDRTIYVYDTEIETWEEIAVPGFIGNVTHMDNLLIVGTNGDLFIYNIDVEEWTTFDFDYNPNAVVTATDGKIAIAGGSPNIVRIYDVASDSWTEGALSIERDEPKAMSHENRMFFIGGEADGFVWTGRIDIYDTESDTWSIDSLSRDRNRFAATIHDDKLIVAGGQIFSFSGQYRKEVDILDLNTNKWMTVEMPTGRRYPSVVGHEDQIYIAGGDDEANNLDIVEIYTLSTSVEDQSIDQDFKMYPNPSSERLNFETKQTVDQVEILDIFGRSTQMFPSQSGISYQLDISRLDAGLYYLKINQKTYPLSFLKQE